MAETSPHTWACPSCGRRVPLRVETCHCGMLRTGADAHASAVPDSAVPAAAARPASPGRPLVRAEVIAAMTGDVKALLATAVLVLVAGLGFLVFGPRRTPSTPAVLGWVDQAPPPAPKPTPSPRPPFKLPWWK